MRDLANKKVSPILDDQPSEIDYLDFASYVQALKELIIHGKTRTPLTLGIFGRWGMGKTTLMKMLEDSLHREGITTIWFNAWQYSNEDELWAAFLQSMLNKIQHSLGALQLPLFNIRLFLRRIEWNKIPQASLIYLLRMIVAMIPTLIVDPVSQRFTPAAKPIIDLTGNLATFILAIWIVGKPLIDEVKKSVSIDISNFQKTSNYQEHIAFLDEFRDHFSDIVQSLPKNADKRLAVFIDDLDRCSPERTIQVLDAIKLFVDVEGCVYILGLDVEVVQKAVAIKYKDDPIAQREYISKIIQLPFQLPLLTHDEMRIFLERLMVNLPDPNCQKVFIAGLAVNPREVKRTINIYSLLWNLAGKRKELKGKIQPVRLAKVVVIQQGYPDLHKILQQQPYLLVELERFFRNDEMKKKIQPRATSEQESDINLERNSHNNLEFDLPPELFIYSKNVSLRSMLLLHDLPETTSDEENIDEFSFFSLKPDEITVYFTLTNRVQVLKPYTPSTSQYYSSDYSIRSTGDIIDGRYKVSSEIDSHNGMSVVYLVHDQKLNRDIALKMLTRNLPKSVKRFEQEMQTLTKLKHPNIISVYEYGNDKGNLYYTMEYFSGGTLKLKIKAVDKLPYGYAVKILLPILDALIYIHQRGIVHRDIKPANIVFDDNGESFLSDFGIIKIIGLPHQDVTSTTGQSEDEGLTGEGKVVGTPSYMSPEQIRGKVIDGRSDLYSLGIMLFEMITGKKPFLANTPIDVSLKHLNDPIPSPRKLVTGIPVALDKIITKLLAKNPEDRYQTAQEVKNALTQIVPK